MIKKVVQGYDLADKLKRMCLQVSTIFIFFCHFVSQACEHKIVNSLPPPADMGWVDDRSLEQNSE